MRVLHLIVIACILRAVGSAVEDPKNRYKVVDVPYYIRTRNDDLDNYFILFMLPLLTPLFVTIANAFGNGLSSFTSAFMNMGGMMMGGGTIPEPS